MALKKKKLYESQLEQVENSILRVSEQQMTLENMRVTAETIGALKQGTDANKATMQARARGRERGRPRGTAAGRGRRAGGGERDAAVQLEPSRGMPPCEPGRRRDARFTPLVSPALAGHPAGARAAFVEASHLRFPFL